MYQIMEEVEELGTSEKARRCMMLSQSHTRWLVNESENHGLLIWKPLDLKRERDRYQKETSV